MGWAEIVASSRPDVPVGGRYYGWFPMARYVDMLVTPTTDGLRDDGPHRAAHAPVYRACVATDRDPFHQPGEDAEDRHALLRGLFVTGFLAEDFFADNGWFGAQPRAGAVGLEQDGHRLRALRALTRRHRSHRRHIARQPGVRARARHLRQGGRIRRHRISSNRACRRFDRHVRQRRRCSPASTRTSATS